MVILSIALIISSCDDTNNSQHKSLSIDDSGGLKLSSDAISSQYNDLDTHADDQKSTDVVKGDPSPIDKDSIILEESAPL